ncbi:alpha-amylase family glycosyl hydrolase [uncultured Bifidobacterium sp.]|uniref:alpha-amylase family glycosyl hydrolase n=1 Tax=uncultured Bifidobacterium sp. TaxID=165187 RepID=UPI00259AAC06|nr:alpha-amylase family glycosyl hydrolase [uncultured Bifidobacterium sp.]
MTQPRDYQRSTVNPISTLPAYDGELGARLTAGGTAFTVWAPTAEAVTLRLFATGSDDEPGARAIAERPMASGPRGTWHVEIPEWLAGVYYDFLVAFPDGTVNRVADPWARAAGVNGARSMVVDLVQTDPEGWDEDRGPEIPDGELVVWETHIGDFSNDPDCGVPAEHRGRFLAFTHDGTHITGDPASPTCLNYLKRLGVTCVQLLPFYDYGSVDETLPEDGQFNWGYDPVNYNVPEGSYSTDPYHGEVRIRECKTMIQALHRAGFKVIMDVVYNHMYSADNWFERMVPGYFCRRTDDGALANGSGCGNDTASEHTMFGRYIVDSVTYWAREYHIDGFRFDLMGLIDAETMNAVRASVDALPGGRGILLYGEPWSATDSAVEPGTILANKGGALRLDRRIGWFCDATRDAIKGHVLYADQAGFVNGLGRAFAPSVRKAVDAWHGAVGEPKDPMQLVQYVSAHDDLTLWDKLCATMCPGGPTEADYAACGACGGVAGEAAGPVGGGAADDAAGGETGGCHGDIADMLAANAMAAGLVMTAAGLPFLLSGEEFARTKLGCSDSFDKPAELNLLDWHRAARMASLVEWYRTLIAVRCGHPELCRGAHVALPAGPEVAAYRVGDLVIAANAGYRPDELAVSSGGAEADAALWRRIADSTQALACGGGSQVTVGPSGAVVLQLPERSFVIWQAPAAA